MSCASIYFFSFFCNHETIVACVEEKITATIACQHRSSLSTEELIGFRLVFTCPKYFFNNLRMPFGDEYLSGSS